MIYHILLFCFLVGCLGKQGSLLVPSTENAIEGMLNMTDMLEDVNVLTHMAQVDPKHIDKVIGLLENLGVQADKEINKIDEDVRLALADKTKKQKVDDAAQLHLDKTGSAHKDAIAAKKKTGTALAQATQYHQKMVDISNREKPTLKEQSKVIKQVLALLKPIGTVVPEKGLVSWFKLGTAAAKWASAVGSINSEGTGKIKVETASGNGAKNAITYLTGDNSSRYTFGEVLPPIFTICSMSRYTGAAKGRILAGRQPAKGGIPYYNWLHGHWNGLAGVSHYHTDGWITNYTENVKPNTNWVVMCGSNRGKVALVNGKNMFKKATAPSHNVPKGVQLEINQFNKELSDWAVAEIITWNRSLNAQEMTLVSGKMLSSLG